MMDLSIIIVSYNTRELLQKCLTSVFESLKRSKLTVEVLVVDNGSNDKSQEAVMEKFPKVKLLENKENVGFSTANNQVGEKATGEYLLFLNSDTEVLDRGIEKLYSFATGYKKRAIFGGKLFNTDKTPQPSCGYFYSLPIVFLSLFLKGDQLHLTRFSPNQVTETDWVSGACLVISREQFMHLGGFDEEIFMYMDEVELCYRAKQQRIAVIFYPEAHFIHVGSASSADKRTPYANLFRGLVYFYQKHWPTQLVILKILLGAKAILAIGVGKLLGNKSLVTNYQNALNMIASYD